MKLMTKGEISMKNLLFILPIICLSLNLQAQQTDPVNNSNTSVPAEDSDERESEHIINFINNTIINNRYITSYLPTQEEEDSEQFTDVEKEFLDAVRGGDIDTVIDFIDVNFMDGRSVDFTSSDVLGKKALAAAIVSGDINMVATLWERGARLNEDNVSTFIAVLAATDYFKSIRHSLDRYNLEVILNVVRNFENTTVQTTI